MPGPAIPPIWSTKPFGAERGGLVACGFIADENVSLAFPSGTARAAGLAKVAALRKLNVIGARPPLTLMPAIAVCARKRLGFQRKSRLRSGQTLATCAGRHLISRRSTSHTGRHLINVE